MKLEWLLKCGCTAGIVVDEYSRKGSIELIATGRIYQKPYTAPSHLTHTSAQYVMITQGKTKCKEHFPPKYTEMTKHKCCHCHCERDCD